MIRNRESLLCACCVLLGCLAASGQSTAYPTTWNWSTMDLTAYAVGGSAPINVWKQVYSSPKGDCAAQSLSAAYDGTLWCIGISDHYIYEWTSVSNGWVRQTAMGTSMTALAVLSASNVYATGPQSQAPSGDPCYQKPGLWFWTGTAWVLKSYCYKNVSGGSDGTLVTIDMNSNLWALLPGGSWTDISSTLGLGSGWTYVAIGNEDQGCAVNAGSVYLLSATNGISTLTQPSFSVEYCALTNEGPLFVTSTSGTTINMADITSTTTGWQTVGGIGSALYIVGNDKGGIFGEDSSGYIYHWNIFAPTLTGTSAGTWDNCPAVGETCQTINPHAVHTVTVTAKANVGGLGLSTSTATVSGSPANALSATAWDAFGQCDLTFGEPSRVLKKYALMRMTPCGL